MKIVQELRHQFIQSEVAAQPVTREDENLILIIAKAIYRGEDVASQYPNVWKRVLHSKSLQAELLNVLTIFESAQLPAEHPRRADFTFLKSTPPLPQWSRWSAEKWQVAWHQTAPQLQFVLSQLTNLPQLTPGNFVSLLQDCIDLEDGKFDFSLQVAWSEDQQSLQLTFVNQYIPSVADQAMARINYSLQWGTFHAKGQATDPTMFLPPVPTSTIGTSSLDKISAPLILKLTSTKM